MVAWQLRFQPYVCLETKVSAVVLVKNNTQYACLVRFLPRFLITIQGFVSEDGNMGLQSPHHIHCTNSNYIITCIYSTIPHPIPLSHVSTPYHYTPYSSSQHKHVHLHVHVGAMNMGDCDGCIPIFLCNLLHVIVATPIRAVQLTQGAPVAIAPALTPLEHPRR